MHELSSVPFSALLGQILVRVTHGHYQGDEALQFVTAQGRTFVMYHQQSCCEHVYLEDQTGDWNHILDTIILVAEESSSDGPPENDSSTWTFYKLAGIGGWMDLRWFGSSNGYYGESADFYEVKGDMGLLTEIVQTWDSATKVIE